MFVPLVSRKIQFLNSVRAFCLQNNMTGNEKADWLKKGRLWLSIDGFGPISGRIVL